MERFEGAILAAGRGERLRAQGLDLPKPLVKLDGETLLARQARILLEAGVDRVVAVVNSETAALLERDIALSDRLTLVVRDTPNSMETLFQLGDHLTTRWFLAATVDAVLPRGEMNRFAAQSLALARRAPHPQDEGALGVARWRGDERPLFIEVGDDGVIRRLGAASGSMVTAGVYFLPGSIFAYRARARAAKLAALRQLLGGLVDWGVRLHAVELNGVIDIDVTQDLEAARRMLARESAGPKEDP